MSPGKPGVEVKSTRNSYCLPSSIVSAALTWCGGASSKRDPSSIPAGYANHTGYQYDSISRVAGQRELAPPSKFSNDGGFRNNVFKGICPAFILTPFVEANLKRIQAVTSRGPMVIRCIGRHLPEGNWTSP